MSLTALMNCENKGHLKNSCFNNKLYVPLSHFDKTCWSVDMKHCIFYDLMTVPDLAIPPQISTRWKLATISTKPGLFCSCKLWPKRRFILWYLINYICLFLICRPFNCDQVILGAWNKNTSEVITLTKSREPKNDGNEIMSTIKSRSQWCFINQDTKKNWPPSDKLNR